MKFTELLAEKSKDIYGARPVTAAFLGDSVTQGCFECYKDERGNIETIFERGNSYVSKFGEIVNMLYPRAQLNIINAGLSGGTAEQAVQRLERDVLRFQPDLLVVGFALNDSGGREAGLAKYCESLREIFRRGKEAGAEVIFLTPNLMCDYSSAHLTEPILSGLANAFATEAAREMLDKYVKAAEEVAKEMSVPVCDCYSVWKNMQKSGVDITALLANYLNHPTRKMQWLAAFKLAEMLFSE